MLPPVIHFQAMEKETRQSTKTGWSCIYMYVAGLDCASVVKHFATAN